MAQVPAKEWAPVEKLISEDKFQAALDATKIILQQTKDSIKQLPMKKNDTFANKQDRNQLREEKNLLWTEALIKATQLQIGLSSFETAVDFLKTEEWPTESEAETLLNLYFAASLSRYFEAYSWEITKREKVTEKVSFDKANKKSSQKFILKSLTTEQIAIEIRQALDASMQNLEMSLYNSTQPFWVRN